MSGKKETHHRRLNKSQRMQMKAFVCVLGLLLLFILLLGRFVLFLIHREREETPIEPSPVIQELKNIWIMDAGEEKLLIFHEGKEESYAYGETLQMPDHPREQIADIVLTDGVVTDISLKTEKINGRILRADGDGIEVEGYGWLPFSEDYKGYRIYNTLEMCTASDLSFGYSFTDLVLDNGQVCGLLMVKEEAMEYIRVLIKTGDYGGLLHQSLVITSDTDFTVQYGSYGELKEETFGAGEEVSIDLESLYFSGDRVTVTPNVLTGKVILKNVNRSQGIPSYRGHMELLKTQDGIALINEVLLEEYLYSVVPSEMPASYPEEALKAQAVCARTYAYDHMLRAAYPGYGAHVDDSTSYQVYNNILEQESTTTAVKETYGQLLYTGEGTLAGAYYYSTSCGVGSDASVWKTEEAGTLDYLRAKALNPEAVENQGTEGTEKELSDIGERLKDEDAFAAFICSKNASDFEVSEGWYRWTYQVPQIDTDYMLEALKKRYAANEKLVLTLVDGEFVSTPISELSELTGLSIVKRGSGGVADELMIETKEHTYKVISEHNIRYVLNNGESKILRQDGSQVDSPSLLPSAFFILSPSMEKEIVVGYTLTGGGFGHGVGMSQNGARNMAKSGYVCEEILSFFYENCFIENVYQEGQTEEGQSIA